MEQKLLEILDIIRSITNNSDNYDEKYMTIKFNPVHDLPLNKTLEVRNMIILEDNKYYPQIFLCKCL